MTTEAKIAIMVQNGKIVVKSQIKRLSQAEIAMLVLHLGLLRDDLKLKFAKGVRKFEE